MALAVLTGLTMPTWIAASAGCLTVLVLIAAAARRFVSPVTTLVFGLMVSYAVGSAVTLLQSSASAESLPSLSLGDGHLRQVHHVAGGLARSPRPGLRPVGAASSRWLDMWTLGQDMAQTMGVPRPNFRANCSCWLALWWGGSLRCAAPWRSSVWPPHTCTSSSARRGSPRHDGRGGHVGCSSCVVVRQGGARHRRGRRPLALECRVGLVWGAGGGGCLVETNPRLVMNLTASNLVVGHSPEHASIGPIDHAWKAGGMHLVLGGNGSGKSSMLRTLVQALPALSGEVSMSDGNQELRPEVRGHWTKSVAFVSSRPLNKSG